MEPQTISIATQTEQNQENITARKDQDLCPVHDTELTDGFCEYCRICYSCK